MVEEEEKEEREKSFRCRLGDESCEGKKWKWKSKLEVVQGNDFRFALRNTEYGLSKRKSQGR